MKKSFSVVIVLLLLGSVAWGAATYWSGLKIEDQYHDFLRQASQWQYLKLAKKSYNRGLFESTAQTLIEIEPPPGATKDNQPTRLTLAHDIAHGPFPFRTSPDWKRPFRPVMAIIETRILFGPEAQSYLAEACAQIPELASVQAYSVVYLDGSGEQRLSIPAFQHTLGKEGKVAVDWKGLSLQVTFTADLTGFTGALSVPGLKVAAEDINLSIEEVKSTFDSHQGISGLALGDVSCEIARLDIAAKKEAEPLAALVRAFTLRSSSKVFGEDINWLTVLTTDQIKIDEDQYGPGIFEMELRNLDAASLAKLQQFAREQETQPLRQSREAVQMAILARLGEILPGMLRKSPEMEVRQLDLKTTLGDFSGKAKIAFDGAQMGSSQTLLALAKALSAEAEFKVGERLLRHVLLNMTKKKIIEQNKEQQGAFPDGQDSDAIASAEVDAQLETLTTQNLLVRDNSVYRFSASYKSGQIVLNGRPLSLQDLIQ
jgi:uncharacterized protein YdgA (DUF945 family)